MSEEYFSELNKKLIDLDLFRSVSSLTYHLEVILSRFTKEEIKTLKEIIEENIVSHYDKELQDKIEDLRESIKYDGYFDENGYWQSEYEKYFDFDGDGGCFPHEIDIINDFDIPSRECDEDYESLEWILEIGDFYNEKVSALDFEIMAVQSIIYLEDFINQPTELIHLSNAFLSFRAAERIATEFEHKGELLTAEHKAKKSIVEKAIKVRHKESRKMKSLVIQRWHSYKKSEIEKGRTPSKTKFAQKIYNELDEAHKKSPTKNKHYEFKTIRNNWLQGIE